MILRNSVWKTHEECRVFSEIWRMSKSVFSTYGSQGWYDWNSIHKKRLFNNLCKVVTTGYVDGKTLSDTDEEFSFIHGNATETYGNKWIWWWHSILSHGSTALPFPMESCSSGLTPGMHAPFVLTPASSSTGSMLTGDSPSGDWLQVYLLISQWLAQVNHTHSWVLFTVRLSQVKVSFQKHFSSGQAPTCMRFVHETSSLPLKKQNLGLQPLLLFKFHNLKFQQLILRLASQPFN